MDHHNLSSYQRRMKQKNNLFSVSVLSEDSQSDSDESDNEITIATDPDPVIIHNLEVPPAGTLVDQKKIRRAGSYILSRNYRSTIVSGISQYLCKKENSNTFFTIKILPLKSYDETNTYPELMAREILHTEYSLLKMLADMPGVVSVHEIFKDYALEEKQEGSYLVYTGKVIERICMVLDCYTPPEYYTKVVNLQHYVIQQKRLSEKEAITIFRQILLKVQDLHKRNIVHRDLKLGNVLYDTVKNKIALFNFGLGKHLPNENFLLTDQKGSPAYISPDVISGKPYLGKPSDMWALGVLFYAMLFGQFPFHDTKSETLFDKIRSGDFILPLSEGGSIHTKHLIRGLLTLDPLQRFTVKKALDQVALIVSESTKIRDNTLQVVPDISDMKEKTKEDEPQSSKHPFVPVDQENIVKINLFSVKQFEATLPSFTPHIPIQQIGQDARQITPAEMLQFTHFLQHMPQLEQPMAVMMTREVPEVQPGTSGQQIFLAAARQRRPTIPWVTGTARARARYRLERRMQERLRERQRSLQQNRQQQQ